MQWRPDGTRVFTCEQDEEIAQNDVSPAWGITGTPSDWSNLIQTIQFGQLRSFWWSQDGTRLSRCIRVASFNSNITVHDQSATPFDLSVLGASVSKTFPVIPALSGGPADHVWSEDGLRFWLHYVSVPSKLYEFSVTVAFDITTLVSPQNKDFDFGPDANVGITTFEFANDGTFLYAMDGQFLVSWDLPTRFDISTATNFQTGPEVPAANLGIPRGLAARSDNTDLSVQGDQNQKRIAWFRLPLPPLTLDPDIDEYTLTTPDINFTIAGNNHLTPWFNIAGDRVYFSRSTSVETWQYKMSPPGNLASITSGFELTHGWGTTQFQRGMAFTPNRAKVYKIRTASSSADSFISADPFSSEEMGEVAGGNPFTMTGVSALAGIGTPVSPLAFVVTPDNLNIFVQSQDVGDRAIYHYLMSVAGDAGTAVFQGQVIDASSEFATQLKGIIYSPSGDKLFILGDDGGTLRIAQYDLNPVFDVTTAVFSGKQITVTPLSQTLLSLFVWKNPAGGFNLYLTWPTGGASNGNQWQYDLYQVSTPAPPPPQANASEYFLNEIGNANPGLSSGTRLDVFWKQDGLKVWTGRQSGTIRQYDVSPAWSIVGSPSDWTLDFETGTITDLRSIWWSPDGTVFAHCQRIPATSMRVTTFDQSATPFDLTVLGASTVATWTPTGGVTPQDIIFSPDGKRLWVQGPIGVTAPILEFELTVGYDMTTLNTVQVKSFTPVGTNTIGFSQDGRKLYTMIGQVLNSFDLSFAFDIDTLNNLIAGPSVPAGNVTVPRGLTFREDNEDIFVAGDQNTRQMAFFRKTTSHNLSDFVFNGEFDTSGGNRLSYEDMWVGPDGLNLYTCRGSIAVPDIFQFSMSPAHDISSLTFVKEDDADGQSPRGIALSESGDALMIYYRNPTNPDAVFRWPTPAPFDIAHNGPRTSLAADFSNAPQGLWFKPDGTQVYLIDNIDSTIYQYNLPTPFEWTGATQTNTFNYLTNTPSASSLTFSTDGFRMYLVDTVNKTIDQYNLPTPFDVSTAVFANETLSLPGSSGGSTPRGVAIRDNFLYVCYQDNQFIEQFKAP